MKIQINAGDVHHSEAVDTHIHSKLATVLKRWGDRVTRVEVHLRDLNASKGGPDKRCTVEVRLAGHQPLAVEADNRDLYDAITEAAGKAERAVEHKLEREQERRKT